MGVPGAWAQALLLLLLVAVATEAQNSGSCGAGRAAAVGGPTAAPPEPLLPSQCAPSNRSSKK